MYAQRTLLKTYGIKLGTYVIILDSHVSSNKLKITSNN